MRTLSMFIIGLVLVSCGSIKTATNSNDVFRNVVNTYRIKNYKRPLKPNCSLSEVTKETTDEYISKIGATFKVDSTDGNIISTLKTHRRITLPNNDGEVNFLEYTDGVKFDTLGVDLFKDKNFTNFLKNNFPSTKLKITTTIRVASKVGNNTYEVYGNVPNGIYNYNGITIKVAMIAGRQVLWSEGDSFITNKTITCFKVSTLNNKTKEEVKSIYILNKMLTNTNFKNRILDIHVKSMSYKITYTHNYIMCVMNVQ